MPQKRKHQSDSARQAAYRARVESARKAELAERGLPPLPRLPSLPGSARWKAALGRAVQLLNLVHDEMAGYYEDRSEVWQESDRGTAHQERVEILEELLTTLEELDL
jgi:hypothetical protein